MHVTILIYK